MKTLATISDLEKVDAKLNGVAYISVMEQMEARIKPMIQNCEKMLSGYTDEQAQFKEVIRRFDEVLIDKVNKSALEKMQSNNSLTYLTKEESNKNYIQT